MVTVLVPSMEKILGHGAFGLSLVFLVHRAVCVRFARYALHCIGVSASVWASEAMAFDGHCIALHSLAKRKGLSCLDSTSWDLLWIWWFRRESCAYRMYLSRLDKRLRDTLWSRKDWSSCSRYLGKGCLLSLHPTYRLGRITNNSDKFKLTKEQNLNRIDGVPLLTSLLSPCTTQLGPFCARGYSRRTRKAKLDPVNTCPALQALTATTGSCRLLRTVNDILQAAAGNGE